MKLADFDFRIWDTENRKYVNENYAKNYHCVGIVKWFENLLGETQDFNKNEFFGFQFFNRHESECGGFNTTEFAEIELWTGIRDKNGKKIYEGDIVKLKDGIYRVWLKNGFFLEDNADNVYTMWFASKYGEVVGNIHENAELLDNRNKEQKCH